MAAEYKSDYAMRIIYVPTGETVHSFAPGMDVESQLVTELCDRVSVKGVGLGRTTAHVIDDVRTAFEELLFDLKKRV